MPDSPILFALEVNKGWFKEHDVKVGDKVLSEDVSIEDADGNIFADVIDIIKPEPLTNKRFYSNIRSNKITKLPKSRKHNIRTWHGEEETI
ncbi:MAG: hypothetical protein CM15mV12_0600 [uncultured marine virus]|nr:MAG: hypothetical protein CM15mV12_0600 [uncultured marine virus]